MDNVIIEYTYVTIRFIFHVMSYLVHIQQARIGFCYHGYTDLCGWLFGPSTVGSSTVKCPVLPGLWNRRHASGTWRKQQGVLSVDNETNEGMVCLNSGETWVKNIIFWIELFYKLKRLHLYYGLPQTGIPIRTRCGEDTLIRV